MSALAAVGVVALIFGLGAYYSTDAIPVFGAANLLLGTASLAVAGVLALRRTRGGGSAAGRRILLRRLAAVAAAAAAAGALERAAAHTDLVWDATADGRYSLAPATREALGRLPGPLDATLYRDALDTRARSTRLLLESLGREAPVRVRERVVDESSDEADHYGVASSNTVVLEVDGRFETVERPTEGALYEALQRLLQPREGALYVARGDGEGSLQRVEPTGYSGLAAALQTEGYELRDLVLAAADEIPEDATALLLIAPRRPLREPSLAALERFLARGGRLVALLEPGVETGLEALLAGWGFALPDVAVVDPASGPIEGDAPGVNPIVFQYAQHPIVRGLDDGRMTFFARARPVVPARKPEPDDELRAVAFSSRRAWLAPDVGAVQRGLAPERPADAEEDYRPLVAAGRYPRDGRETRIVVFGDADFANNRHLRALYNLDLALNAVHWAAARERAITLRPKTLTPDQFPMTPQQSLRLLYGVGLVIPELCLLGAALTWVRRRSG